MGKELSQRKKNLRSLLWILVSGLALGLIATCGGGSDPTPPKRPGIAEQVKSLKNIPIFNSDSAYSYIAKQVAFGPRVPGTPEHEACGDWMEAKLKTYADKVISQNSTVTAWNGDVLPIRNIIASFNPEQQRRVLLCAHWDTRPWADNGEVDPDKPILGANDGGSGVGVLIEFARMFKEWGIDFGLDIILFDTEDYGSSEIPDSYCLGSQYWCRNPHVAGYQSTYGILLDMVGGENAIFKKEEVSRRYAGDVLDKVWQIANLLGYSTYFINQPIQGITDDHLYINQMTSNRCIDIIHHDGQEFGAFWHTHDDDMNIISKETLRAVGETVLTTILVDFSQKAKQPAADPS